MNSKKIKTQVGIIGGGPAGMLLAHALHKNKIKSIVVEKKSREYVLKRIRAGILESTTVKFLEQLGLAKRLKKQGFVQKKVHYGFYEKDTLILDLFGYTKKNLTGYGQTFLTEDLYNASDKHNRTVIDEADDIKISGLNSKPKITFKKNQTKYEVECQFVVGCDGSHGTAKYAIPKKIRREWEKIYPFGWLGILTPVKPMNELFYARGKNGFVLASKRTPKLSRYYVQCKLNETIDDWSDQRFWDAMFDGMPKEYHKKITVGPSIEKSIAPLRSYVSEPMQYKKLFLAGDATHIVPPTGAKGLNLAVSDVYYLSKALDSFFNYKKSDLLEKYSETALRRVWSGINISWQFTNLLHKFNEDPFELKIKQNQYDMLLNYKPMQAAVAFEAVGLPL